MSRTIEDFTERNSIHVLKQNTSHGALVYIEQRVGSMSFAHFMTTKQARELSAALLLSADEMDAEVREMGKAQS